MKYTVDQVEYRMLQKPQVQLEYVPVNLNEKTMTERKEKVLSRMRERNIEAMFIYGDREHGANFAYLTGFVPRFEEAVLVLHQNGKGFLLLGNEMLSMNAHSRIHTEAVYVPYFSLPNQPMETDKCLKELLGQAGLKEGMKIGVAGWKLFTNTREDKKTMLDIPAFLAEALKEVIGDYGKIRNECGVLVDPENGARTRVNANEIAFYEFGASLASRCVLECMDQIEPQKTEMELASFLSAFGQPTSVQTICAGGERFKDGIVEPRYRKVKCGDRFSVTMGLRGGLSSRAAYVAESEAELPAQEQDYLEQVAKPYFAAAATWYSTVGFDITAGELYEQIETVLPKKRFGWKLNPGHLTADEEWLSSPVYEHSSVKFKSGMMLQMDIIPQVAGYGRAGAEDGIVLADKELRDELRQTYPKVWERMVRRRDYMERSLGIYLKEEVLPMSEMNGYFRPFLLKKDWALRIKSERKRHEDY